jgi:hypothetical protein
MTFNPNTILHDTAAALRSRLALVFGDPAEIRLMAAATSSDELKRMIADRSQFIGLGFVRIETGSSPRVLKGATHWSVLVSAQNEDAANRLLGDSYGTGLFAMITVAAGILHGWTIDGLGAVEVTGVEVVRPDDWSNDAVAMAEISVCCQFTAPTIPAPAFVLDDFLRLQSSYDLPGPAGQSEPTDLTNVRSS